jgi:putative flippase GtrA
LNGAGAQFLRYGLVGGVAFAIDSAVTMGLALTGVVPPHVAKVIAFVVAALTTFPVHWRFTFRNQGPMCGVARYLAVGSAGAVVNLAVFSVWLRLFGVSAEMLFAGIVAASGSALVFNFLAQRAVVFAERR